MPIKLKFPLLILFSWCSRNRQLFVYHPFLFNEKTFIIYMREINFSIKKGAMIILEFFFELRSPMTAFSLSFLFYFEPGIISEKPNRHKEVSFFAIKSHCIILLFQNTSQKKRLASNFD